MRPAMEPAPVMTDLQTLSRILEQTRIERARALARSGNYAEAESELSACVRSSDRQTRLAATLLLAKIRAQQGAYEEASALWRQTLAEDPSCLEAAAGIEAARRPRPLWPRVPGLALGLIGVIVVVSGAVWMARIGNRLGAIEGRLVGAEAEAAALRQSLANVADRAGRLSEKLDAGLLVIGDDTGRIDGLVRELTEKVNAAHNDIRRLRASSPNNAALAERLSALEAIARKLDSDLQSLRR